MDLKFKLARKEKKNLKIKCTKFDSYLCAKKFTTNTIIQLKHTWQPEKATSLSLTLFFFDKYLTLLRGRRKIQEDREDRKTAVLYQL